LSRRRRSAAHPRLLADERGIAMTEGAIVAPFFVLIWMGLIALHLLHGGRLAAQLEAGSQVLAMAAGGDCGDADMSLDELPQTSGIDTGLGAEEAEMIESIAGAQPFAWAHATAAATLTVEGIAAPFGGPTREVTGRRVLMCNMRPVDGLMDLVASVVQEALGIADE
jgi:hypothetical protein